ncbi:MAG TPA: carboxypeptidase regulatory-like domain-containing protein [Terriglobales bacterium]|nr:carboxypeptidase regulatory-like domain-containing protein [Terriglobales bacterium]
MERFRPFLLALLLSLISYGLGQTSTGSLQVQIFDPSGAVLPGADVTIRNLANETSKELKTSANGVARFDGLESGRYKVTMSAKGFQTAETEVEVRVAEVNSLKWTMPVGSTAVQVEVETNAPDAVSTVISNPVSAKQIEETPLANRSFANIAYIAPMTAPVEPSDPTKARITAVSFAGSSGLNVDLSVDGGDNNDDYIGGFLQNFSPEAIREFNVRTAQFEPDTSRTNGGSIVISTRSGSNNWHGSGSGFFRAEALNARNTLDNPEPNPKQPYSKQDYVGTLGGPIKKDQLWLFAAYEYNHEDPSVAYSALSLSEFNALAQLASSGEIPGATSINVPSSVTVPFRDHLFDARLDWQQSERSRWFLRYALDRNQTRNDLVQQGALPSTGFTTNSHYNNAVLSNQFPFAPAWLGSLVVEASLFDHTKIRNSNLGFALAFPFSTTSITTSGFETFGDNQFISPLTAFPIERDQQKYQFRYDVTHSSGAHSPKFGINLIHEPVLRGRFADSAETLAQLPEDPSFYLANPGQFAVDFAANATDVPATDGTFSQSVRRLGFYGQDNWRVTPHLMLDYGLRYDTTFGLFIASGKSQNANPALQALQAAGVPFASGVPHDYRGAFSPRAGFAYSPGDGKTVFRAGAGLYYNDLGQNGWAEAFQAVNGGPNPPGAIIDPHYHSPYAFQASASAERAFARDWVLSGQFEHQEGVHQYRRYEYVSGISLPATAPSTSVFRADNRSSYDGGSLVLQHHGSGYDVTAHYTLARATTWGATVGELFDYVNGVTNALDPFGPGDHGPSGEDIRHRFVVDGIFELPWKFQIATLAQFESARPYTMFTPVDINGDGNVNDRAVVNGVQTSLDQFRGRPFSQIDLRVSRNFKAAENISVRPFAEFFNLLNRTNAGNNFIPDISALPAPVNDLTNATAFCLDAACTTTQPITSLKQLRVPAGALGDFFGPGTTVGIPFAAQLGVRVEF